MLTKIILTLGALGTWLALGHFGLIAVVLYIWLTAMATTNTAKTRDVENRVGNLVTKAGQTTTRVNNLSGQNTSTAGLPDGTIGGHTDTAGLNDGTISGTSGPQNGGAAAHTHGPGSYSVTNGQHQHGANATNGNLAVNNGQHNHSLPNV